MTKQEIVTAFEKEFKNQFVADNISDCIPVKNWEEMSGEVMLFIKDLLTEFEQAVREEMINIIKDGGTGDTIGIYKHNGQIYINQRQLIDALLKN